MLRPIRIPPQTKLFVLYAFAPGGGSTTEYTAADILGRVTAHKQTTDGVEYTTGYSYDLGGNLLEQTYPLGRVVKNTLDSDGALSQVQSKRSSGTCGG